MNEQDAAAFVQNALMAPEGINGAVRGLLDRVQELEADFTARMTNALTVNEQRLDEIQDLKEKVQELEREVARLKKLAGTWRGYADKTPSDPASNAFTQCAEDLENAHAKGEREPPVVVPATNNDLSKFAAQLVTEPMLRCSTCQHLAKNHTLGRCRKKKCGCGGWRG